MLNYADQINQKRGIALIKVNGRNEFNDKDYFGYDDFSAKKVEREDLWTISDLSESDIEKILSDSRWKNEDYFIAIKTKTDNEELHKVFNYQKLSLYGFDKEELILSIDKNYNNILNVKNRLLILLIILLLF